MKKIALTGGPCAGKSTVLEALAKQGYVVVLEVARQLLPLLPVPGTHCQRTSAWQEHLQKMILATQVATEEFWQECAEETPLVIFDRGILDGAAFTEGGKQAFCFQHDLEEREVLELYDRVIHLQSLAVADSCKYQELRQLPVCLSLEQAQAVEQATLDAWENHPNRIMIEGSDMAEKIRRTLAFVESLKN